MGRQFEKFNFKKMKKVLLSILFVAFIIYNCDAKCYRVVEKGDGTNCGFTSTTFTDPETLDCWITCYLSDQDGLCPTAIAPGGGGDPTDQTAAAYLFGLADYDISQNDDNGSYYAAYQVSGEANMRHYSVVMTYNSITNMITQEFNRID